jgi:hypothetical protein
MNRLTKLVVLASMTIAVVVEAALMRGGWAPILPITVAVLLLTFAVGLRFPASVAAFVLLFTYTCPALVAVLNGQFEIGYMTVWVAGLLGVILASGVRSGWAVPSPWRMPIVLWALTVSLAWPVVALREADFSLLTLDIPRLSVTGPPGVPPLLAIVWTLNVALVLGVGILWFDWLFSAFSEAESRFRIVVLGALAASWVVTTAVGAYQLLVDITFLNSGRFGFLQRASGLMFDANPFGVIAALGVPVVAAVASLASWRGRTVAVSVVATVAWMGLWASGSRTALATGIISTLFVLYYYWDRGGRNAALKNRRPVAVIGILAALVIVSVALQRASDVGPWRRLVESLPGLTLAELWNRNGYGLNAGQMIRDFPGFGVGVGSFHHLVLDYSRLPEGGGGIPIDNAQNWYRHQLAEFGVVGSLGWIAWTLSFAWFVLTSNGAGRPRGAAGSVKGALVAIALISLLGMPTQSLAVALTFWTLAFWYVQLAAPPSRTAVVGDTRSAWAWLAVVAVAVVSAVGTAYSARHDLRVPARAARFGWPYAYGWYAPEGEAAGRFQWAARHAVAVLDAPKPWMKLTVSINHADIERRPVDVEIWRDRETVMATTIASSKPVTHYVPVPDGRPRIVLETWVNRAVRPADFGIPDPRELGLMVQWDFVDSPVETPSPPKSAFPN